MVFFIHNAGIATCDICGQHTAAVRITSSDISGYEKLEDISDTENTPETHTIVLCKDCERKLYEDIKNDLEHP